MQLNLPFLIDPKDKLPSVSLSLLVFSFVTLIIASILHMAGKINETSSLTELFYACAGLYFGRKFQGKSGNTLEKTGAE